MKPLSLNPLYLIEYQTDIKVLPTIFVYYTNEKSPQEEHSLQALIFL